MLAVALVAAAAFAPYVDAELSRFLEPHVIVDPPGPQLAAGAMVDDYWAVQPLGGDTYAIGEPRYYQQNYAYLIVGRRRALLFDAGSGTRDIGPIVARLTKLPVTLVVSHLHFDHLGGVGPYASVAMIDLPQTRADVAGGRFAPTRYQYLGLVDGRRPPSVTVAEWLKPDTTIDLGGRMLRVLSTPGHTPTSVSLYDPAAHRLFAGDYIYPTTLYAFLPGASLSAYHATARRLLSDLPADTILWTAHCCRAGEKIAAPWLAMSDLKDLDAALSAHEAGRLTGSKFYPRRFPVSRQITLATGFPWNNR
jgi:glyoxylase-like metal-dependent hydrolase (beta-lactamase superfamily II)